MPPQRSSIRGRVKLLATIAGAFAMAFSVTCFPWPYRLHESMFGWSAGDYVPNNFGAAASTGFFTVWGVVALVLGLLLVGLGRMLPADSVEAPAAIKKRRKRQAGRDGGEIR
jgi:hypothetical protein